MTIPQSKPSVLTAPFAQGSHRFSGKLDISCPATANTVKSPPCVKEGSSRMLTGGLFYNDNPSVKTVGFD
ncbi:MAG: hypothetical protein Q4D44_08625, partial [Eubacteriales bacterium]|nr:hypothetical protein [Eubacteriales bacterium]